MKKQLIPVIVLMMIMISCEDYDLSKSIFIPDKQNPDLPAYSEWGYNTFGAYYDREPFVNDNSSVPAKVINTGGITSFLLIGHFGPYNRYYTWTDESVVTLRIDLPDFSAQSRTDLLELNDVLINLNDPLCKVYVIINGVENEAEILSGTMHFTRAQNLIVDKEPTLIILSGTFEMQAIIDGMPSSITNGRFDVGISNDNFFIY